MAVMAEIGVVESDETMMTLPSVNADLKLTHFCSKRRFKSDTPPFPPHTAYAAGAVSRLLFTIPAAR